MLETATLAGGCFWCTEATFRRVPGVHDVEPGYSNGHTLAPRYEDVCTGQTGHAEVIQLTFDPAVVSFQQLLEVFFATHDPTTPNRQGHDVGSQYRSAIFTHSAQQADTAAAVIKALTDAQVFDHPIVTEVEPVKQYHPAEAEHRRYYEHHPNAPYCAQVIAPKLSKLAHLLAPRT